MRGARCLAGWVLCLADTTAKSTRPQRRTAGREGSLELPRSDRTYGARRVWRDQLAEGEACGLHRIERLMRLQALKARPRRRRLPPDLGERQVAAVAAERARPQLRGACSQPQMDSRLHLRVDSGRLALCRCRHRSVLPSRGRLVDECRDDGTARDRRPGDGDLATRQARRAAASLRSRQPIHSRAVPGADGRSRRHLLDEPLGNVWDNAAMESFFSSLKTERTARKTYRTRDQAKADVFDYIECFYNPKRRHSTIGRLRPWIISTISFHASICSGVGSSGSSGVLASITWVFHASSMGWPSATLSTKPSSISRTCAFERTVKVHSLLSSD